MAYQMTLMYQHSRAETWGTETVHWDSSNHPAFQNWYQVEQVQGARPLSCVAFFSLQALSGFYKFSRRAGDNIPPV